MAEQDTRAVNPRAAVQPAGRVNAQQVTPVPLTGTRKTDLPEQTNVVPTIPSGGYPLEKFLDVPVTLVFEVGRTQITIGDLMELNRGSYLPLGNMMVDVIDVRVNERIIAFGEAISLNQRYGVRFGELETVLGLEDLADEC